MKMISGIKSQILTLLFLNENEEFYVRQIACKLARSPRGVLYELNKLDKEGIIKSRVLGNLRLFSTNINNPTYQELRGLIIKNFGIPEVITKYLGKVKGINTAFLFGSVAKGDFDADSDIDLFIKGTFNYQDYMSKIKKAENELGREINSQIISESEYKNKLSRHDPFIMDIECGERIYLIKRGKVV